MKIVMKTTAALGALHSNAPTIKEKDVRQAVCPAFAPQFAPVKKVEWNAKIRNTFESSFVMRKRKCLILIGESEKWIDPEVEPEMTELSNEAQVSGNGAITKKLRNHSDAKMVDSAGSNSPLFIYHATRKAFGICGAFIFALSCLTNTATAQLRDSTYYRVSIRNLNWKKTVTVPCVLISAGLISLTDNDVLDNEGTAELRNRMTPEFRTHVDDYLQYAPILGVYGLNALGIKGKHDFKNRTALLIKSELIMAAITFPLKKIIAEPRPDTGAPTSFPSGHTAQAFAAATFFHKEYGRDHPALSFVAYSIATSIGVLRVLNNRHHASDVLAGAGIGILSTNLAYLTHQNKWRQRTKHKTNTMVSPFYSQGAVGVGMMVILK